ncbi:MAG: HNH endonuclease [Pirellulales bacterium]|nr:HNH endonuclease [Pirellulales bacterium]
MKLEVHHIVPYKIAPHRELDSNNLITLCRGPMNCHLTFGHLGSYRSWNQRVVEMATKFCQAVRGRP